MSKRPPRNGEIVEKINNVLLVDGNSVFKNGFFGAKDSYNHNGKHVGGLLQFLVTLRKLLNEDLYHRVYVFWDGNLSGKLRYDIYNPYKSSRGKDYVNGTHPIDESELEQRRLVWEYLNELYVRQLKDEVIESDDFIGYYCINKRPNEKITILTSDRDFCQLIDNGIRIYFLDLKNYVDLSNFNQYFCYNQSNAGLIKIMIGDNSDTIKGIKGLGETKLLSLFPELKERKVTLNEIIDKAKTLEMDRANKKQKPLKVLHNIVNKVTDGVQKEKIYEINKTLIDLTSPMITYEAVTELDGLINGSLDSDERDIKNVIKFMYRDGLDKILGETRFADFLEPFKKLEYREKNN